jgi:hypothetical protein
MALAIGLTSRAAAADPPPPVTSALNWTRLPGAESCIGVRELQAAVEKRIGRALFVSATEADVLVEGNIEPISNARGWRAQIRLSDADGVDLGTREIQNKEPSCRSLDPSLALAIALMVDPESVRAGRPPVVIPKEKPPAAGTGAPPPPAPPVQDHRPQRLRVKVAAGASLGWGFLPGFGAGAAGRVALERNGSPGLEIDARLWPSQTTNLLAPSELFASFWSAQGGFSVCPLQGGKASTRFTGCLGTTIAIVHATFPDEPRPQESTGFRVDLTTQGRLSRRILGPLLVDLGFTLGIPISQPSFFYARKIPLSYVVGSADVGISIEF